MFTFDRLHENDTIYLNTPKKAIREGYSPRGVRAMITKIVDSNNAYVILTEGSRVGHMPKNPVKIEQVNFKRTNQIYEAKGRPLNSGIERMSLLADLDIVHTHNPITILGENTIAQRNVEIDIPSEIYESKVYAKFINENSYVKIYKDKFNEFVVFNDKNTHRFKSINECYMYLNRNKYNFNDYTFK